MRKLRHDEIPRLTLDALPGRRRHPVCGLLHNIRSLHNVGSMFRTSDAALIEHLHLTGITGTPLHPGLHRTALGAQDTVPWSHNREPLEVVARLLRQGYTIAALEITDRPTSVSSLGLDDFPLCLVVGHEVHGVADELLERCDLALEIPQYGAKTSLNVAVAFGIAVYGVVERYRTLADAPPPSPRRARPDGR